MEWIYFTVLAALMQAVRTAGQKQLSMSVSAIAATWARYGFGFPLAVIYLLIITNYYDTTGFQFSVRFLVFVFIAAVAQLSATLLLVKVLSQRNFAVGTTYAKSEAILAAVFATLIFGVQLSVLAWIAIVIGIVGIMLVSVNRAHIGLRALLLSPSALLGISSGACFALTAVFVRQASQLQPVAPLLTAAVILALSILLQGLLCSVLVHQQNPDNWRQLAKHAKANLLIGSTGTLGSIGWYTAFAYQHAAVVKTFGQIEFIFTVLITYGFFKERISRVEWFGMSAVIVSVLVLFQAL